MSTHALKIEEIQERYNKAAAGLIDSTAALVKGIAELRAHIKKLPDLLRIKRSK